MTTLNNDYMIVMRLTEKACRDIKHQLEALLKEFHVADAVKAIDLQGDVNYFELDQTSFALAVETCMLNVEQEEVKRILTFFLPAQHGAEDINAAIKLLMSQVRAASDKQAYNDKIKAYLGMDDIFAYLPIAFRGRNYMQQGRFNNAIYINMDHQELQSDAGCFEHLVTHEYLHLNARGKGFIDWRDDKGGRPLVMCQKLDEGVTELLARLVTYRRNKSIMFADLLPKYEIATRVADALLGDDGHGALANGFFLGKFEGFNRQLALLQDTAGNRDTTSLLSALANVGANMERIDAKYIAPLTDWGVLTESSGELPDRNARRNKDSFEMWKGNLKAAVLNGTYIDPVRRRALPAHTSSVFAALLGSMGSRS